MAARFLIREPSSICHGDNIRGEETEAEGGGLLRSPEITDDAKNARLRAERHIGFEDIVFHIERGDLLDILERPNPGRYAGQQI